MASAAPIPWVIWSTERDLWWRANEWGYTPDLTQAGLYEEAEAKAIVDKANRVVPNQEWCVPWPAALTSTTGHAYGTLGREIITHLLLAHADDPTMVAAMVATPYGVPDGGPTARTPESTSQDRAGGAA